MKHLKLKTDCLSLLRSHAVIKLKCFLLVKKINVSKTIDLKQIAYRVSDLMQS